MPDATDTPAAPEAKPDVLSALDELERRLERFDAASRKLAQSVHRPDLSPDRGMASSGNRPAIDSQPRKGEDISAFRPAVFVDGVATGALTARRRSGPQQAVGFTSAFGRPNIPATAVDPADGTRTRRRGPWYLRPWLPWVIVGTMLGFWLLSLAAKPLPELSGGEVGATSTTTLVAEQAGVVDSVQVRVGDRVAAKGALLHIGPHAVTAPADRLVTRLMVMPGARVATGEALAELADPETIRIFLPLNDTTQLSQGERVDVLLLGERRRHPGTVERIERNNDRGAVATAILAIDAATVPRLGQGARITPLGQVGGLRLFFHHFRQALQ